MSEYGINKEEELRLSSLPDPVVTPVNVGGTVYRTLLSTLRSQPESLLAQMFDGQEHQRGAEGMMEDGYLPTSSHSMEPMSETEPALQCCVHVVVCQCVNVLKRLSCSSLSPPPLRYPLLLRAIMKERREERTEEPYCTANCMHAAPMHLEYTVPL